MFQLTPPHKGRQSPLLRVSMQDGFNSRPRIRGDIYEPFVLRPQIERFNSRPRIRGDFYQAALNAGFFEFQLTPPHKGRLHIRTRKR